MNANQSTMSGSYISTNLDEKLNGNRYSYLIDGTKIKLASNPLDDYHRTIFPSRTHTNSIDPNNNYPDQLPSLFLKIKQTSYKSRLVQNIRDIPVIGQLASENNGVSNITGQISNNQSGNTLSNVLHCFEYALPNIELPTDSQHENIKDQNKSTFENRISMSLIQNQQTSNNVANNIHNSQYLPTRNNITPPTTSRILKGIVVVDNPNLDDYKIIAKKYSAGNGPESIVYSITKNQAFKNRKLKYLDSGKKMLFHPNNIILWSENLEFVYMTGIWRLYQDVMNGLSSIERQNCSDNNEVFKFCKEEYDTVVRNLFGKASDTHNTPRTNSRNKKSSNSSQSDTDGDINEGSKTKTENIKQIDFKWEKVNPLICKEVLECYKCYLINDKKISPNVLQQIEQFNFVQKVRGGFIHIQGTWLPTELARPLCIMFAYPIRYLLTPVFGANFPKECENWYKLYEENGKEFKVFAAVFRYTNPHGYSQYNPSRGLFHPSSNMSSNRFVYSGGEGNFFASPKNMQQPFLYSDRSGTNSLNQPVVFQQQQQDGSSMYNGFQIPTVQNSSSSSNYNNLTGKKTSERENSYNANNEKIINLPPINHLLNKGVAESKTSNKDDNNNNDGLVPNLSTSTNQIDAATVNNSSIQNGGERSMVIDQGQAFVIQNDGKLHLQNGIEYNNYTTGDAVPYMVANNGNFVSVLNNHVMIPNQQIDLAPLPNQQIFVHNEYPSNQTAFTNTRNPQDGTSTMSYRVNPYVNTFYNQQIPNSQFVEHSSLLTQQNLQQPTITNQVPIPTYIQHQRNPGDTFYIQYNQSQPIISSANPNEHFSPVAVNYLPLQSEVATQPNVIPVTGYYRPNDDPRYVASNDPTVNILNNTNANSHDQR